MTSSAGSSSTKTKPKKARRKKKSRSDRDYRKRSLGVLRLVLWVAEDRMYRASVTRSISSTSSKASLIPFRPYKSPTPWKFAPLTKEDYEDLFGTTLTLHKKKLAKLRAKTPPAPPSGLMAILMKKRRGYAAKVGGRTSIEYALAHTWPPWGRAGEELKLAYYQAALDGMGASCAFSMNLCEDDGIQAKVGTRFFMNPMRQRIKQALERMFKRKVPFWFALEVTKDRPHRAHLHGALAVSLRESAHAISVLRKCSGITGGLAFRHSAKITDFAKRLSVGCKEPNRSTLTWAAGYAVKDFNRTRRNLVDEDAHLTASSGLKERAQALYEADAAVHAANYVKVDVKTLRKMYPVRKRKPRAPAGGATP